jgi:hypothetical protein
LRALVFVSLLIGAVTPSWAQGQETIDPVLRGRLTVSGVPADTGTVVIHRVTPEEAGDIDSVSVQSDGSFTISLPNLPIPGSGEVFLASARFDGVLYAGPAIADPIQLDSLYNIQAYFSEIAPAEGVAFPLMRREVWIDEGPVGWQVTDVLELRNPGNSTLIPEAEDGPVWRYPLPEGAIGGRVLQVGPVVGPARIDGAVLTASNPIVPADNYYIIQYDLESIEMDLPLPGETGLVQLLVREPGPAIQVEGLARQPSEEIEVGVSFMRWAGQSLRDQRVSIRIGDESRARSVVWMSAILSIMLVAAGTLVIRRRPSPATGLALSRSRRDLLVEIATLDEEFTALQDPSQKAIAQYQQKRTALVEELRGFGGHGSPQTSR